MKIGNRAFTLLEIIISVAIISILILIGSYSFSDTLKNKELIAITDNIVATLELARSNSITGKDGSNYGVKFNSDSYVYFIGTSYVSANQSNISKSVSTHFTISNDIPGSDDKIVFSKINGESNHASSVTITISKVGGGDQRQVIIGTLGDITMVQ